MTVFHTIPPVFSSESKTLILGSFPSVKSREINFYYGHEKNRFWKVLAAVFNDKIPESVCEKKEFILLHKLALWDVIYSCEITGSADSTIKNAVPNDISKLVSESAVTRIFLNGKTAEKYYVKYVADKVDIPAAVLPSTSPANAAFSLGKLVEKWSVLRN